MDHSWFSNFVIYWENLSSTYLFLILASFLAVFLTWLFCDFKSDTDATRNDSQETLLSEHDDETNYPANSDSIGEEINNSLMKSSVTQKVIDEHVRKSLTEEQLEEEKETEKKQLEAIFKLMREQEDKFQVSSMEELEDQLKLYRR